MEDFNFSFITLPETVVLMEDATLPDLSGLVGLLDDQTESLQLDFESLSGDPIDIAVIPVKPIDLSAPDLVIDTDWNPIIEELYYTSEVG